MALNLAQLAASWHRLWARETLPECPPRQGRGPSTPPGLLARLLARERLPEPGPAVAAPHASFLGRLLAREHLPHPSAPAPQRDRDPE